MTQTSDWKNSGAIDTIVSMDTQPPIRFSFSRFAYLFRIAAVTTFLSGLQSAFLQAAPVITSVTPADGATGVATPTPIVFVFSEAMDPVDVVPSIPPFLIGNVEVAAPNVNPLPTGTWSADGLTLTVELNITLPANTTFAWRLNPPGMSGFATPIQNTSGIALATTMGTFKTGAGGGTGGPQVVSVAPGDGSTNVAVSTTVVFTFDQAMNTTNDIAGSPPATLGAIQWQGTGLDPAKFSYSWSSDAKSLTCDYLGDLPVDTEVEWILNPPPSLNKLKSQTGEFVAMVRGSFTTGGGVPECHGNGVPTGWGSYGVSKYLSYSQTSSADPTPSSNGGAFIFSSSVLAPAAATISSASVELPNVTQNTMTIFGGTAQYFDEPASETALDTSYPPGNYTLHFTLSGQAQQNISIALPANTVPVPKISNFGAAQNVIATADFTLQWNGFATLSGGEHISLNISDSAGNIIFTAPDPCVPRDLQPSAKSIVIPANTLLPGRSYTGSLNLGRNFYSNTNAVPQMYGFGDLIRTTEFTITSSSGGVVTGPATLATPQLLQNGNPEFHLSGTAGKTYNILRAGSVNASQWLIVGTVTMDVTGGAVFEDSQVGTVFPLFYKAVGN